MNRRFFKLLIRSYERNNTIDKRPKTMTAQTETVTSRCFVVDKFHPSFRKDKRQTPARYRAWCLCDSSPQPFATSMTSISFHRVSFFLDFGNRIVYALFRGYFISIARTFRDLLSRRTDTIERKKNSRTARRVYRLLFHVPRENLKRAIHVSSD